MKVVIKIIIDTPDPRLLLADVDQRFAKVVSDEFLTDHETIVGISAEVEVLCSPYYRPG